MGLRVEGVGLRDYVEDVEVLELAWLKALGLGVRVEGLGSRVKGLGFIVYGFEFRVGGLGICKPTEAHRFARRGSGARPK